MIALAVHFSPLDLAKLDRNGPPLEVALVNAKSASKPTKAEILAQARLDGGGNTDANRRAKSPLPVLPKESASTRLAVATRKVDALEQRTSEMMAQRIIINRTSETVLRFLPPFVLERKHVDQAIAALDGILSSAGTTISAMAGQAPAGEHKHG